MSGEFESSAHDGLIDFYGLAAAKRGVARDHLVDQDAETPGGFRDQGEGQMQGLWSCSSGSVSRPCCLYTTLPASARRETATPTGPPGATNF